jgi:hypothetical protein
VLFADTFATAKAAVLAYSSRLRAPVSLLLGLHENHPAFSKKHHIPREG